MNNNGIGKSTVIARHDYLPFGEEISSGVGMRTGSQGYNVADANRQKYAMLERDSTGLDHTWWRKYESTAGRWTSPDPLAGSIGDPQSLNHYTYSGNDPVNLVDPSGLEFCSAEYGFAECGGNAGFWGGNFGAQVARYNREYGGLSRNTAEAMHLHDQRVYNAIGGLGFLTSAEVIARYGGAATGATATLCFNGDCWVAGVAVWGVGDSFDLSSVNLTIPTSGAGMIAGAGEFSNVAFGYWRAPGYGWYRKSWGGNGSTGGKLQVLSRARAFRFFGRAAFAVGVLNTGYQYYQGNISGTRAIFDIGFATAGTLGGPWGFGANVVYTGVDMTVGWRAVGNVVFYCDANCQYRANHFGMFAK